MASIPIPDPASLPPVPLRELPRAWLRLFFYRYLPLRVISRWIFFSNHLGLGLSRKRREKARIDAVEDLMPPDTTENPLRIAVRTQVLTRLGRNTFAPVFARSRASLIRMLRPVGLETLDALKEQGQGAVIVGSHCGYNSWYGPALLGMGYPLHLMQRHHVSPGKLLMYRKADWGKMILPYPEPGMEGFHLKKLHDMLRQGQWLQHIGDRPDRKTGIHGELFGRPVRCVRAPWTIARLAGVPAVPVFTLADEKMRPQMIVGPAIHVSAKAPANQAQADAFHTFLQFLENSLEGRRWNLHPRQWASLMLKED